MNEAERAEVEVRLSESDRIQRYRLESVDMRELNQTKTSALDRVERLQHFINSYSNNWELIQILDTIEGADYIHLLYREQI